MEEELKTCSRCLVEKFMGTFNTICSICEHEIKRQADDIHFAKLNKIEVEAKKRPRITIVARKMSAKNKRYGGGKYIITKLTSEDIKSFELSINKAFEDGQKVINPLPTHIVVKKPHQQARKFVIKYDLWRERQAGLKPLARY
jgi:uncharacterized Zn finger protein (UPF0148 family)